MTPRAVPQPRVFNDRATVWQRASRARWTAVAAVWISSAWISAASPDLVTGPAQRHVQVAALSTWVWAMVATVFLRLPGTEILPRETVRFVIGTWGATTLLAVTAPVIVVGQHANQIPLMACLAPALAALATGYALLAWLTRPRPGLVTPRS